MELRAGLPALRAPAPCLRPRACRRPAARACSTDRRVRPSSQFQLSARPGPPFGCCRSLFGRAVVCLTLGDRITWGAGRGRGKNIQTKVGRGRRSTMERAHAQAWLLKRNNKRKPSRELVNA
ncbi:unnamed protein product [Amoebophrya sp. A120]|nr:unnamed protein product [Amoebophrya sp. A120]|eukprot:GSA120T00003197001.1